MYEKEGDSWRRTLKTSAVLGKNGSSGNKREGDGKTPIGLYPLRDAFGIKTKPSKVNYPYTKTTKNDYWVDDPTSSDYNKGITYKGDPSTKWNSFERMSNSLYQYGVIIGYNDDPVIKGKGSAIFLHVWRNSASPTLGCVAIAETKLVNVLQNLKVEKNPHILIGTKASNPTVYTE
ncbi:L,D-transpeptidase family protein [Metabacillus litoralis]|uniref:L,D-transpeptidase family protein n=2 Tax=Metabacillus litoralis TaxID=152268 RepID=A0A5C6W115_9BACI|nr:L,D-transpeptidase family protein [Metabacillus litoralis]